MHRIIDGMRHKVWALVLLMTMTVASAWAKEDIFPRPSNPPRMVNDLAGILSSQEEERLEHKLVNFDRTTSTQITIVIVPDLHGYEVADFSVKVFNEWGVGQKGKNNGVLLLIAPNERKAWITTGGGLQGVLTDAVTSRIFRNELRPAFKEKQYYTGLDNATDAIIAVTKGEYKGNGVRGDKHLPFSTIAFIVIIIIIAIARSGRGGGGGRQYRRSGIDDLATGWIIGNILSGGRSSGGGWGGGDSGGFGGFGGGSSDGGGAGGSW